VLKRSSLGHVGGYVSSSTSPSCHSYGGTAVAGYTLWVPCTEGVTAFHVHSGGQLHYHWRAASNITGSPVAGGHRVWALDPSGGRLYSLNPVNGATVTSISVGTTSRFATPALYGHHVIIGTLTGVVVVGFS
jgi:outer membrane protein assembly factor BamB